MLPHLDELTRHGYKFYFQFTLTPYGHDLEQNLRPKAEIEDTFIELSKRIAKERVVWRYDPIILNDNLNEDYHKTQFRRMCEKMSPYTDTVIVSFVDIYPKIKTSLIRPITNEEIAELSDFISKTSKEHGLRPMACCEKTDLSVYGIEQSSCIDKSRIEKLLGSNLKLRPDKNQRASCGCCESIDIGAYNTCINNCVYCYANNSPVTTKRRYDSHDPKSELLIGTVGDGEKIVDKNFL